MRLLKTTRDLLFTLVWLAILAYLVSVILTLHSLAESGARWWTDIPSTLATVLRPGFLAEYIASPQVALIAGAALIVALVIWVTITVRLIVALIPGKARPLVEEDPGSGSVLISDTWLEAPSDPLGYHELATSVAKTIMRSVEQAPFAIAFEGRWGVGKTTLMKLIEQRLTDKRFPPKSKGSAAQWTIYPIWFNPWRHRKRDVQKAFMSAVFAHIPWRDPRWYTGPVMLRRVIAQGANFASFIRGRNNMGTQLSNKMDVRAEFRNTFQENFEAFLRYWSKGKGNAQVVLVIFIDDLDRCAPTEIAPILEAMKLFFENKRCIFVLGFDPDVVAKSISREYDGLVPDGLRYLQKLVQVEFPLFQSRDEQLERLLADYITAAQLTPVFEEIGQKITDYRSKVLKYTHRTPRQIKRLINGMALMTPMHSAPSEYICLFYLLLMQAHWRVEYDRLCAELLQGDISTQMQLILRAIEHMDEMDELESA